MAEGLPTVLVRLWVPGFAFLPPFGGRCSVMAEKEWQWGHWMIAVFFDLTLLEA